MPAPMPTRARALDGTAPAPRRRRRPAARRGPGRARRSRTLDTWAAGEGRPEQGHRDRRQEGRQRQPDLEGRAREVERRRLVAPQRVARRGRGPRGGCGRRRRSRRCPPAWGTRSAPRTTVADDQGDARTRAARSGPLSRRLMARPDHGVDRELDRRRRLQDRLARARSGQLTPSRIGRDGRDAVLAVEDEPADVVGAGDAARSWSSGSLTSTTPPRPVQ